jgi:sulfatase maturation enzyme AslB (radical SAM superfamily)
MFESEGITSWQTIPVEKTHTDAPNPVELGNSYKKLFNNVFERVKSGQQKLEVRSLSQYLSSMFIHNGIDACRICSSGNIHPLIAIDYDGEVYPCDYFFGNKKVRIGNIYTQDIRELAQSDANPRMRDINRTECSPM